MKVSTVLAHRLTPDDIDVRVDLDEMDPDHLLLILGPLHIAVCARDGDELEVAADRLIEAGHRVRDWARERAGTTPERPAHAGRLGLARRFERPRLPGESEEPLPDSAYAPGAVPLETSADWADPSPRRTEQ